LGLPLNDALDVVAAGGPVNRNDSDPDLLATLGRNLQAARLSAGLTQQELADLAGVDLAILAQIERGCRDPGLNLLDDLAHAVRCAAVELLGSPAEFVGD
jgi:DNA-binding XRE family transcriptional regulator